MNRDRILTRARWLGSAGFALAIAGATACQSTRTEVTSTQPGAPPMTEPMVAGLTRTIHDSEIEAGRLALQKSTNENVRQFAQRMINEHTNLNQQLENVVDRLNMDPAGGTTNDQLRSSSRATLDNLREYEGNNFDRTYIQNQIDMHRWAIEAIDQTLIPASRRNPLQSYIRDMRPILAAHLQDAERIMANLPR